MANFRDKLTIMIQETNKLNQYNQLYNKLFQEFADLEIIAGHLSKSIDSLSEELKTVQNAVAAIQLSKELLKEKLKLADQELKQAEWKVATTTQEFNTARKAFNAQMEELISNHQTGFVANENLEQEKLKLLDENQKLQMKIAYKKGSLLALSAILNDSYYSTTKSSE